MQSEPRSRRLDQSDSFAIQATGCRVCNAGLGDTPHACAFGVMRTPASTPTIGRRATAKRQRIAQEVELDREEEHGALLDERHIEFPGGRGFFHDPRFPGAVKESYVRLVDAPEEAKARPKTPSRKSEKSAPQPRIPGGKILYTRNQMLTLSDDSLCYILTALDYTDLMQLRKWVLTARQSSECADFRHQGTVRVVRVPNGEPVELEINMRSSDRGDGALSKRGAALIATLTKLNLQHGLSVACLKDFGFGSKYARYILEGKPIPRQKKAAKGTAKVKTKEEVLAELKLLGYPEFHTAMNEAYKTCVATCQDAKDHYALYEYEHKRRKDEARLLNPSLAEVVQSADDTESEDDKDSDDDEDVVMEKGNVVTIAQNPDGTVQRAMDGPSPEAVPRAARAAHSYF